VLKAAACWTVRYRAARSLWIINSTVQQQSCDKVKPPQKNDCGFAAPLPART
jgi:hypothetical protein